MSTFLVAHGAWAAGWAWKKMHPLMAEMGHRFITPTYTGLGERAHLSGPSIDLDTHIQDILNVIGFEGLSDLILIGHSYGGMVATGVADRASEKIARLVYLDAFVPEDGQCLFDLVSEDIRENFRELARTEGEGWKLPPNPMPPDTPDEDRQWAEPLRVPMPIRTVQQPLQLTHKPLPMPITYVYCNGTDTFLEFANRARERGWDYFEMDASHNPHITEPEGLAELFDRIARAHTSSP